MEWLKLDRNNLPNSKTGPFLCTNAINARDAHGRPSHVWLTHLFHADGDDITCFAHPGWTTIYFLTHYAVIDFPEKGE